MIIKAKQHRGGAGALYINTDHIVSFKDLGSTSKEYDVLALVMSNHKAHGTPNLIIQFESAGALMRIHNKT
jgi:hypothetical protein